MALRILIALFLALQATLSADVAFAQTRVEPDGRVVRNVTVRAGPSTSTQPIDKLLPGATLDLREDLPNWYKVALPDGREGFVSKAWTVTLEGSGGIYRVHVIDVGTGLSVFVEGPGFTMLYDAGSQDDTRKGERNRVIAYLRKVRPDLTRIDHLVLSHAHKDHIGLMEDIFDRYEIRNVWDSGAIYDSCGYRAFLRKIAAEPGIVYHSGLGATGTHRFVFAECNAQPKDVDVPLGALLAPSLVPLDANARMEFLYVDTTPHADPNENSLALHWILTARGYC